MTITKTGITCDYCGRFISYTDQDAGRAIHRLLTPDTPFSREEFESYHTQCRDREMARAALANEKKP